MQGAPNSQAQTAEGQQADPLPAAEVNRAEQVAFASQLRQLLGVESVQLVSPQLNFLENRRHLGECNTASRGRILFLSVAEHLRRELWI